MVDETYDRHYQAARTELNEAISRSFARFGKAIANAFQVLNRIEYESPWKVKKKRSIH